MGDQSTIFNSVNLFLTLLFGAASIYVYVRSSRKSQITYVEEDCISLFHDALQNIEGIAITYKGKSITTPSLFKLNGCLVNNGKVDIDQSKVHKALSIQLPEGFKCLDVGLNPSSSRIEVNKEIISEREVQVDWDLLKKDEFVRFSLLIEASEGNEKINLKSLLSGVSLSHRITDLGSIAKENISILRKPKELVDQFLPSILFGGIGLFFIWCAFNPPTYHTGYMLSDNKGNELELEIYPSGLLTDDSGESKLQAFLKPDISLAEKRTKMFPYDSPGNMFSTGLGFFLCGVWYVLKQLFSIYRLNKLKRILNC